MFSERLLRRCPAVFGRENRRVTGDTIPGKIPEELSPFAGAPTNKRDFIARRCFYWPAPAERGTYTRNIRIKIRRKRAHVDAFPYFFPPPVYLSASVCTHVSLYVFSENIARAIKASLFNGAGDVYYFCWCFCRFFFFVSLSLSPANERRR